MSTPARTVLVTGAMGQVGKRATQLLLDRGRTVIALDLGNDTTEAVAARFEIGSGALVPAYVNLLDAEALTALLAEHRPDAIIHLAAVVAPPAYKNPSAATRVNVKGTANLVAAAQALGTLPLFLEASSSGVYGSRNPHTNPGRLAASTPVNPIDCYGQDKVRAEEIVAGSGLPHATLRLGGIISPDALTNGGPEYDAMVRAFPHDCRIHAVDARDVALAFVNGADCGDAIGGKVLMIGGNESYVLLQSGITDDLMAAVGIGRLGTAGLLPGNPADEDGWGLTDWFDTAEAQQLLDFQKHDWDQTCAWVADSMPAAQRRIGALLSPLVRLGMRSKRKRWLKSDRRGQYADPWNLMTNIYGPEILASKES